MTMEERFNKMDKFRKNVIVLMKKFELETAHQITKIDIKGRKIINIECTDSQTTKSK